MTPETSQKIGDHVIQPIYGYKVLVKKLPEDYVQESVKEKRQHKRKSKPQKNLSLREFLEEPPETREEEEKVLDEKEEMKEFLKKYREYQTMRQVEETKNKIHQTLMQEKQTHKLYSLIQSFGDSIQMSDNSDTFGCKCRQTILSKGSIKNCQNKANPQWRKMKLVKERKQESVTTTEDLERSFNQLVFVDVEESTSVFIR